MRLLPAALLLAAGLAALPAAAQDAGSGSWDARLTAVTGEVSVYPAGGGEAIAASSGMPLDQGDRVATSSGSSAEISLDGSSLIDLQEDSEFTLERTEKSDTSFFLSLGTLLAKIQALGGYRMSVRTPDAVAAVRGTEFGVESDANGESRVGVFDEGRVEVTGQGGREILNANQETAVRRGFAPERPYALRRFLVRRARMRAEIRRLRAVRRGWRRLSSAQRSALRGRMIRRMRRRRRERLLRRRG
ncbi:MAG: FecR domain-containing protein, partial [Elusimicrobia bacterium]|nr:FecR domain-containing protein [Elusimicrobiota bacterium]